MPRLEGDGQSWAFHWGKDGVDKVDEDRMFLLDQWVPA